MEYKSAITLSKDDLDKLKGQEFTLIIKSGVKKDLVITNLQYQVGMSHKREVTKHE